MKNIYLFILFAVVSFSANAQTLTGSITGKNNSGISNAHITTNAGAHTHSTKDGKFVIDEVKLGDTLLITHISYMSQSVIVRNFEPLSVVLSESSFELAAVEVRHSVKAINSITEVDVAVNPVTTS